MEPIFGFVLIAFGAFIMCKSYKKKTFTSTLKPGQTIRERQEELLKMSIDEVMAENATTIAKAWVKMLGIILGLFLLFVGLMLLSNWY